MWVSHIIEAPEWVVAQTIARRKRELETEELEYAERLDAARKREAQLRKLARGHVRKKPVIGPLLYARILRTNYIYTYLSDFLLKRMSPPRTTERTKPSSSLTEMTTRTAGVTCLLPCLH